MLLIGYISRKLRGSSLIEVLVAMLIALVCFALFISFFTQFNSSGSVKNRLREIYLSEKEWFDVHLQNNELGDSKNNPGFQISRSFEKTDSLVFLEIKVTNNRNGDTLISKYLYSVCP
jgi:Tfp pilus assembly protein PilV